MVEVASTMYTSACTQALNAVEIESNNSISVDSVVGDSPNILQLTWENDAPSTSTFTRGRKRKGPAEGCIASSRSASSAKRACTTAVGTNEQEEMPRVGCPFYQHDPHAYHKTVSCRGKGFSEMGKLKDHLKAVHKISQERRLKLNFKQGEFTRLGSMEEKWKLVYRILFPEVPKDQIPSPYTPSPLAVLEESSPVETDPKVHRTILQGLLKAKFGVLLESCIPDLLPSFEDIYDESSQLSKQPDGEAQVLQLLLKSSTSGTTRSSSKRMDAGIDWDSTPYISDAKFQSFASSDCGHAYTPQDSFSESFHELSLPSCGVYSTPGHSPAMRESNSFVDMATQFGTSVMAHVDVMDVYTVSQYMGSNQNPSTYYTTDIADSKPAHGLPGEYSPQVPRTSYPNFEQSQYPQYQLSCQQQPISTEPLDIKLAYRHNYRLGFDQPINTSADDWSHRLESTTTDPTIDTPIVAKVDTVATRSRDTETELRSPTVEPFTPAPRRSVLDDDSSDTDEDLDEDTESETSSCAPDKTDDDIMSPTWPSSQSSTLERAYGAEVDEDIKQMLAL